MAAGPAYAASTCSHTPRSRVTRADRVDRIARRRRRRADRRDRAHRASPVRDVVVDRARERVGTHRERRRRPGTCTTFSRPTPSAIAAFSMCECVCSVRYTRSAGRSGRPAIPRARMSRSSDSRAAASAVNPPIDAVSYTIPWNASGRPSIRRSQPSVTSSSSVAAGDVRHSIALTSSAAASASASTVTRAALIAKYAKKRGWFQCVMPGITWRSKSSKMRSNGSPSSGASAGSARTRSPGCARESTGYRAPFAVVVVDPGRDALERRAEIAILGRFGLGMKHRGGPFDRLRVTPPRAGRSG